MKGFAKIVVFGLFGLSLAAFAIKKSQEPITVGAGSYKIGSGDFESHNFSVCSAVIFDYGTDALYAHALPTNFRDYVPIPGTSLEERWKKDFDSVIFVDNVVKRAIQELERRDIDISEIEVDLYAGKEGAKGFLEQQLKNSGFSIRYSAPLSHRHKGYTHTIRYNSIDDKVEIERFKF